MNTKTIILLIIAAGAVYVGYTWYQKKKSNASDAATGFGVPANDQALQDILSSTDT